MDMLISLRGVDLLRVKGIVNVEGKPVVVQAVQYASCAIRPVTLDAWPERRIADRVCVYRPRI